MAVAAIPYIVMAIAAVASAASDYMSSSAQAGAAIDTEKYNRDLLRRQADNEALVTSLAEDQQRREAAFSQARTRAGLLEAGIGTAVGGSAVAVSGQAAKFAELDALNIRWEGNQQRTALLSQADLTQYGIEGLRTQRAAGKFGAVMQGVQGVASSFAGGMGQSTPLTKAPAGTGASMPKANLMSDAGSPRRFDAAAMRRATSPSYRYSRPVATSSRPRLG